MSISDIREKLYTYISIADDKKIEAIYTILEEEITENIEWWQNTAFVTELNNRYAGWQEGREKAFSLADIDKSVEELKRKRK